MLEHPIGSVTRRLSSGTGRAGLDIVLYIGTNAWPCVFTMNELVMTMPNSGSYPVTLVAHSYSGHGRADMPLLSTTLGLYSIHSLPHLAIYPVCS